MKEKNNKSKFMVSKLGGNNTEREKNEMKKRNC